MCHHYHSVIVLSLVLASINETMTDEAIQKHYGLSTVMASMKLGDGEKLFKLSDFPIHEKLEKFMEDVK